MTSVPAAPGNPAPPPFCLTCNDLQSITGKAIVDLAANPYLLCEEAAAKAMFARAAMDHGLGVVNQDTNGNLIAMQASKPGYGLAVTQRQGSRQAKAKQKNKDLLLSKSGLVGEADVQFKVHPGYGVKDLSTQHSVGKLVRDLTSLSGGQSRRAGSGRPRRLRRHSRVQAVVLVLANTNGQWMWLDGSKAKLPNLIPGSIAGQIRSGRFNCKATTHDWTHWHLFTPGTQWVQEMTYRWVRLAFGTHVKSPIQLQCAAFKARSALNAGKIGSCGGTHDIYAFVWMQPWQC